MIVSCDICHMFFDDEFRLTFCPHDTFAANDGQNNFAHHPESYLSESTPEHDHPMSEDEDYILTDESGLEREFDDADEIEDD